MGSFRSERVFHGRVERLDEVAADVVAYFRADGYLVSAEESALGGWDISITKGGTLKAIAGLRTALKVLLVPEPDRLVVTAGVGIFGRQVVPSALGLAGIRAALIAVGATTAVLLTVPLLVTQAWGLIRQSKLDDEAMRVVHDSVVRRAPEAAYAIGGPRTGPVGVAVSTALTAADRLCGSCGDPVSIKARFCGGCGGQLG